MKRLNYVRFDSNLNVLERSDAVFRQFSGYVNVIEVLAPFDTNLIFYGIAQPKSKTIKHANIDRHRGKVIRQELIEDEVYNVWEFTPLSIVMNSKTADKLAFVAEFHETDDTNYLGSTYPIGGTNSFLLQRYPEAETGDFVRNVSSDSDWEFNGMSWVDTEERRLLNLSVNKSEVIEWSMEANQDAGFPEHDPTVTENIYSELNDRPTFAQLEADYYNKTQSDDRFKNKIEANQEHVIIDGRLDDLEEKTPQSYKTTDNVGFNKVTAQEVEYNGVDLETKQYEQDGRLTSAEGRLDIKETELIRLENDKADNTRVEDIEDGTTVIPTYELKTNKGSKNGYAPLVGGKVPANFIPNAFDDVLEFDTYADLLALDPSERLTNRLYVVIADEQTGNDHSIYRWSGSGFVLIHDQLSASEVKELYEGNADTNAFTDDLLQKVNELYTKAQLDAIFIGINNDLDDRPTKLEVDTLIEQLKSINGWVNSDIGTLANGEAFSFEYLKQFDILIARVHDGDDIVAGRVIKATDLANVGNKVIMAEGELERVDESYTRQEAEDEFENTVNWQSQTVRHIDNANGIYTWEIIAGIGTFYAVVNTDRQFTTEQPHDEIIPFGGISDFTRVQLINTYFNVGSAVWLDKPDGYVYKLVHQPDPITGDTETFIKINRSLSFTDTEPTIIDTTLNYIAEGVLQFNGVGLNVRLEGLKMSSIAIDELDKTLINLDNDGHVLTVEGGVVVSKPNNAVDIDYDNSTSGLTATNVQEAVDEVKDGSNDWLNVNNVDETRTDKFKLGIENGKLYYEIEEGE